MKKGNLLVILMVLLFLLCGCNGQADNIDNQPTVNNIFVPTNVSTVPTVAETTNPEDITDAFPGLPENLGGSHTSFPIEMEKDETGRKCYEYNGGEMSVAFQAAGSGVFTAHGVGFLLFVDGMPQPYRVSEDGEYSYMHGFKMGDFTLDPDNPGDMRLDVSFMFNPITGEKGDYIECYIVMLYYPDYSPAALGDKGARPYTLGSSTTCRSFVLKFMEDPPETQPLPTLDRLYDTQIEIVDTTYKEIQGWTNDDMQKNIRTVCYVNGYDSQFHKNIYDVTKNDIITVQFEIYGSPLVQYRLVYFVNNEPVSVAAEDIIDIYVEAGKKTIVTAKLDISDFNGECSLYCVLVARNRRDFNAAYGLNFTTDTYSYFWLHDFSNPLDAENQTE